MKIIAGLLFLLLFSCAHFSKHQESPEKNVEVLHYTTPTFDQSKISLDLYLPEIDQANQTTILLADDIVPNSRKLEFYAQQYGKLGYTVVLFRYRNVYNPYLKKADSIYFSNTDVTDLMTALAWVRQNIQSEKIGIHTFDRSSLAAALTLTKAKVDFCLMEDPIMDPLKEIQTRKEKNLSDTTGPVTFQFFPGMYSKTQASVHFLIQEKDRLTFENSRREIEKTTFSFGTTYMPDFTKKKNRESFQYWDSIPHLIDQLSAK